MEAVEKSQISDIHQRGEGSDGQWRWRRGPVVLVRKREGEDGLNWGQRWRMGGSHREAAEPVALRRNRRGGGVSSGGSQQGGRVGSGEGGRSSSSGAVERRTAKRGSGWRPTGFQAPPWRMAVWGKRRGACGHCRMAEGEGGEGALNAAVNSAKRPARAPGRRAHAMTLSLNRVERQGTDRQA
jgi:hypothetical protein